MSYRTFRRPDSAGWTTANWVTWAAEQGLLLDVRNDIPEGVCTGCYGGTKKTYEDTSYVQEASGLYTLRTELRRWPRCYQCQKFEGLEGILPISYSISDRLESAIALAKDHLEHRWLNLPLASILNTFLQLHLPCIESRWGGVDVVTVVPSHPSARAGWDHMKHIVSRVSTWPVPGRWDLELLRKVGTSDADTRRDQPHDDLFQLRPDRRTLEGQRVLLLDDTYTTGGTLRSAGMTIMAAGGHPIAVTIGRQVRRDEYGAHIVQDALARTPRFNPLRCAIH